MATVDEEFRRQYRDVAPFNPTSKDRAHNIGSCGAKRRREKSREFTRRGVCAGRGSTPPSYLPNILRYWQKPGKIAGAGSASLRAFDASFVATSRRCVFAT